MYITGTTSHATATAITAISMAAVITGTVAIGVNPCLTTTAPLSGMMGTIIASGTAGTTATTSIRAITAGTTGIAATDVGMTTTAGAVATPSEMITGADVHATTTKQK